MLSKKKYKILVYALSGIGDALMFTPALKIMRDNLPGAVIDVVVMYRGSEEIIKSTGLADKVIRFDFLNEGAVKSFLFVASLFGRYTHSISVYPSNRKEYNIINFLSGAKHRGAVKYIRQNIKNLGFLNSVTIDENDATHNVESNVKLVSHLFGFKEQEIPSLIFNLTAEDEAWAEEYLTKAGINKAKLIFGMHPGCSTLKNHIKRRWEPEKFSALADVLSEKYGAPVLIFGGPEEAELKEQVRSGTKLKTAQIVDAPSLSKSAALIKKCSVFITNDSSLMHVAAAMQVKTVAIIGPTNTHYISPWKTNYKIASLGLECAPCFFYSPRPLSCSRRDVKFKCIKELTPEHIAVKTAEFLS